MNMAYENIGNIASYTPRQMAVKTHGLITSPELVMKLYTMLPKGSEAQDGDIKESNIDSAKRFLLDRIGEGEIKPEMSGMGFAILSEDVLNATVWANDFPVLGINKVYFFSEQDLSDAKKADPNKSGAYCAYEARILAYEAEKWLAYLKSPMQESDKAAYLESGLETIIG